MYSFRFSCLVIQTKRKKVRFIQPFSSQSVHQPVQLLSPGSVFLLPRSVSRQFPRETDQSSVRCGDSSSQSASIPEKKNHLRVSLNNENTKLEEKGNNLLYNFALISGLHYAHRSSEEVASFSLVQKGHVGEVSSPAVHKGSQDRAASNRQVVGHVDPHTRKHLDIVSLAEVEVYGRG